MKRNFIITAAFVTISLITRGQNVGIGTGSPVEKLQVVGNIKADTVKPNAIKLLPNAGEGKVLTSDASGNASWQKINGAGSSGVGFGSWGDCSMSGLSDYLPVADSAAGISDLMGYSVSVSGDFAFVGVPLDDIGANNNQGSVIVYRYTDGNWTFFQQIVDNTGGPFDVFGNSVFVSGNLAVIGAKGDANGAVLNQGSASIYQFNGSTWVFTQKLLDPTGTTNDYFGNSVSFSGNYLIVGASEDDNGINTDQGSASVFHYNGSTWVFVQKLFDISGAANDRFGHTVSISGNLAVIGEPFDDITTKTDQGAVLFYRFNGSSWVLTIKLTDATGYDYQFFGASVSISGNYAAISSYGDKVGLNDAQGTVSIYHFNGTGWDFVQQLWDPQGEALDYFGSQVSLSGNLLAVGCLADKVDGISGRGSVSVFARVGMGWGKVQQMNDKMGNEDDYFGCSVSIDENNRRFVVGAYGYLDDRGKAIFGKLQQ